MLAGCTTVAFDGAVSVAQKDGRIYIASCWMLRNVLAQGQDKFTAYAKIVDADVAFIEVETEDRVVQVRVVDPDVGAVGDDQLREGLHHLPAELPRGAQLEAAAGRFQQLAVGRPRLQQAERHPRRVAGVGQQVDIGGGRVDPADTFGELVDSGVDLFRYGKILKPVLREQFVS